LDIEAALAGGVLAELGQERLGIAERDDVIHLLDSAYKHWAQHGAEILASEANQSEAVAKAGAPPVQVAAPATTASTPKVSVSSSPEGADIEVDGDFVGSTPSTLDITPGEHQVVVKKSGYKDWTRKLRVSGGNIKLDAELEKQRG
ncbi:MAG TPA: PEGA domain-containing protein, partial [Candidatus Binatia bacterium]|nr:PEGA domain-containing protein [Candidatus Binatia bacterium]